METAAATPITIETSVNAPVEKVWKYWTEPQHIMQWNQATDEWHCPRSENDLREGGNFSATMAAKDGSFSFDFGGTYTKVREHELIEFEMSDGRMVNVKFAGNGDSTNIVETFDPESTNSLEMQRNGWQSILDSFRRYTEAN